MRFITSQKYGLHFLGVILVIALGAFACATVGQRYEHQSDSSKERALIFLHGFYGANLNRQSTGERIWLTASQALWKSNTLAIDESGMEIPGAENLVEDGILRKVDVLPVVYNIDAYGETLDYFEKQFGATYQIVPLAYDWRRDNLLAVKALGAMIDQLRAEGKKKIVVVGHSMGGLVLAYYLRYGTQDLAAANEDWSGAEKIDLAMIVGSPFRGTIYILRNMLEGVRIGWNSTLLRPESYGSFASAYQMLPEKLELFNAKGELKSEPTFDSLTWEVRKWGLLAQSGIDPISMNNRVQFTRERLANGKMFRARIEGDSAKRADGERQSSLPKQTKTPGTRQVVATKAKLISIFGEGYPTIARGVYLSDGPQDPGLLLFSESLLKEHVPGFDPARIMVEGDETITAESARLPKAYKQTLFGREIRTKARHSALLNEPGVRRELEKALESL